MNKKSFFVETDIYNHQN